MTRDEVEATVREWVDQASVDPRTGLPPDAKVALRARYITTIGHRGAEGRTPERGLATWSVGVTLYFPDDDDPEIPQVLERLARSLEADPRLGQAGLRVQMRHDRPARPGVRPEAPEGYEHGVDLYLAFRHWDLD